MGTFEYYLKMHRKERILKNAMYEIKSKTREQKRQRRNDVFDSVLIVLLLVDLFLFALWIGTKLKEEEEKQLSELPEMQAIVAKTDSFEIPCSAETPVGFYADYEHHTTFTVTHYCGCSICCGTYSSGSESEAWGASGSRLEAFVSVAVDPRVIPLGTVLHDADGRLYRAEDTGGAIKGNRIDLFVGDHQEALNLGVREMELWW